MKSYWYNINAKKRLDYTFIKNIVTQNVDDNGTFLCAIK